MLLAKATTTTTLVAKPYDKSNLILQEAISARLVDRQSNPYFVRQSSLWLLRATTTPRPPQSSHLATSPLSSTFTKCCLPLAKALIKSRVALIKPRIAWNFIVTDPRSHWSKKKDFSTSVKDFGFMVAPIIRARLTWFNIENHSDPLDQSGTISELRFGFNPHSCTDWSV